LLLPPPPPVSPLPDLSLLWGTLVISTPPLAPFLDPLLSRRSEDVDDLLSLSLKLHHNNSNKSSLLNPTLSSLTGSQAGSNLSFL